MRVGADHVRQHVRIPGIAFGARGPVPLPVPGRLPRIDRIDHSRRTSSSQACQPMASQAGNTPSGPFTVTASTIVSVSMAPNLPFGSGGSDRIASKAHLPTSAPFRARAGARCPAGYAGRPAEGLDDCPGFPSPYGAPAFASWASCSRQGPGPSLPPAYRQRLTALRILTGFPRSACASRDRGGCPLDPEASGVHAAGEDLPGRRVPFLHG